VLLDAFRHDYLGRTRFLQQIAANSLAGALEEPFGFCPRGAYFGGLSMAEQGYTNIYRFDPQNSVFGWTRELAGTSHDSFVRERLRSQIMAHGRATLPPYAAMYLDPVEIPLPGLSAFDPCEQHAAWSRNVGYRSLFHILEDSGRSWMEVSWPYVGWTGGLTSGRVAAFALERLRAEHSFAFIHLPDLDIKGHPYGPGSREIQAALEETDRLCEILTARICELYRDPVILFAGDHGMLPVVRTVDVARALAGTGLRWEHDVAYFVDSTMVRCWFFTEHARRTTLAALSATGGGRIVSDDDKRRWGLTGIDWRNGEEIYLADPGVVFSPSFFDGSDRSAPRGMHGYAPDVPDNRAIFLAHWPRRRQSGHVGVVEARRLFPSFLQWLGWDPAQFTSVSPVTAASAFSGARWSTNGTQATDAVVDRHFARITQEVRQRAPEADAVIIAGGFGRGEGTIVSDETSARPVNDYDVVVVGTDGAALAGLDTALARELGMDFVELWARPSLSTQDKLSQYDFDLRYGSRLLWGNPLVLDRLPRHAPADLALEEGIFQIGNRSGGLLLGLTGYGGAADGPGPFLTRQGSKFLIAVADAWLMALADYHASYAIRRQRFHDLAAGTFSPHVIASIDEAFSSKLHGQTLPASDVDTLATVARTALIELEHALGWTETPGALERVLTAAAPRRIQSGTTWLKRAEHYGLAATGAGQADTVGCVQAIYRGCLHGVRHWPADAAARTAGVEQALVPHFAFTTDLTGRAALGAVAQTWLSFFH
jgi:hypothetical protein